MVYELQVMAHGTAAVFGLMLLSVGAYRIYSARQERRAVPPTNFIKYSEGVWRIAVGLGLIGTAATASLI